MNQIDASENDQVRESALERAAYILNRLIKIEDGGLIRGEERVDLFQLGVALMAVEEALETYKPGESQ